MSIPPLPLLVICLAMVFLYRYYNNANHSNPLLHKFHKRLRVGLGAAVVGTLVSIAYQLPTDFSRGVAAIQANQVALAAKRQEARQTSEIKHVRQMIDVLGGEDNYLAYLKRRPSL